MTEADKQMLSWIKDTMQFDRWYPIKSDEGLQTIIRLFDAGQINECELNTDRTSIRKIELDYPKKKLK
jgi:hypothetical protein